MESIQLNRYCNKYCVFNQKKLKYLSALLILENKNSTYFIMSHSHARLTDWLIMHDW
jgi:hypothetical protein